MVTFSVQGKIKPLNYIHSVITIVCNKNLEGNTPKCTWQFFVLDDPAVTAFSFVSFCLVQCKHFTSWVRSPIGPLSTCLRSVVLGPVVSGRQGGVAKCPPGWFLLHDTRATWQLNSLPTNVSPTLTLDLVLSCLVPAPVSGPQQLNGRWGFLWQWLIGGGLWGGGEGGRSRIGQGREVKQGLGPGWRWVSGSLGTRWHEFQLQVPVPCSP